MRDPKRRILDALRAVAVGLPFIVLVGIGGYGRGHRSYEAAGEAAAAPLLATVAVAIVAASWRRQLRSGELAVLIFLITALLYGAMRH
jgi:hypothetical protein